MIVKIVIRSDKKIILNFETNISYFHLLNPLQNFAENPSMEGKMANIFKSAAKTENKVLTLTFLREGTKILLGMKKRGLGQARKSIYF